MPIFFASFAGGTRQHSRPTWEVFPLFAAGRSLTYLGTALPILLPLSLFAADFAAAHCSAFVSPT